MPQSDTAPAANAATTTGTRIFRSPPKIAHADNAPTTPIETIPAPIVVNPPCDKNSACNTSATLVTTTVGPGPISSAANPVPHGCEHVPTHGTGMGMHEITNTPAPTKATNARYFGSVRLRCLITLSPQATNGSATANHNPAQEIGSTPSEICIACAGAGHASTATPINTRSNPISLRMVLASFHRQARQGIHRRRRHRAAAAIADVADIAQIAFHQGQL